MKASQHDPPDANFSKSRDTIRYIYIYIIIIIIIKGFVNRPCMHEQSTRWTNPNGLANHDPTSGIYTITLGRILYCNESNALEWLPIMTPRVEIEESGKETIYIRNIFNVCQTRLL